MSEKLIAGLREIEANEVLKLWLESKTCCGVVFTRSAPASHEAVIFCAPFSDSDDSIRQILNAMNELEKDSYCESLSIMFNRQYDAAMLATPAQKCEALIRALGLAPSHAIDAGESKSELFHHPV